MKEKEKDFYRWHKFPDEKPEEIEAGCVLVRYGLKSKPGKIEDYETTPARYLLRENGLLIDPDVLITHWRRIEPPAGCDE